MTLNSNEKAMIATCHSNTGKALSKNKRHLGETDQTDYSPLKIGESYPIYALLFISNRVDFLIRHPEQNPFWAPSCLFNLIDPSVPAAWEICITHLRDDYKDLFDSFNISCIIGYPLIANDYKHYAGLIEGDSEDIQKFISENLLK